VSRLGKSLIHLPKGVELKMTNRVVTVKGPKGTLTLEIPEGIQVKVEGEEASVQRDLNIEMPRASHGLYWSLINNMVVGVSQGFEKKLSLVGVGYRANVQGALLDLQLGYSQPVRLEIPSAVKVSVDKSVTIVITGIDKQVVGQFAASVRAQRPPEPYKGKGIRYEGEYLRKKAGKAAKGKAA
jgi:large subunit ribosomal protein L6